MATSRICSIPGCGKPHRSSGYCNMHYLRWRHGRDLLAAKTTRGEPQRYFRKVVLNHEAEECLIWPYGKVRGYARLRWRGRDQFVHRIVCEMSIGPAPTKQHHAAHNCGRGNIGCVAKRHIEWKTVSQNQMDRVEHGTSNRGSAHGMAKLTEDAVRAIRVSDAHRDDLAALFHVSEATIRDIKTRKSWWWLT